MKTDLFNYDLPPELIAQHPPERRELARMMVLHRETGQIEHRTITDIVNYLRAPDVLVLNNTKVIPARVFGHKTASGGKVVELDGLAGLPPLFLTEKEAREEVRETPLWDNPLVFLLLAGALTTEWWLRRSGGLP